MSIHVIPTNDIYSHTESADCDCEPRVEKGDYGDEDVIIHNSYDRREIIEEANRILESE